MTRTIVVSDIHGEPAVLTRALDEAGFVPGADRLVVAGDCVEVGRDSAAAVELVESLGAEVLVGNHELGIAMGEPIEDDSLADEDLFETVADRVLGGAWRLATLVDGIVVTHAGVSGAWRHVFARECDGEPSALVAYLNEGWPAELERAVERGSVPFGGLAGLDGPLWFRPDAVSAVLATAQLAGHTPPEIMPAGLPGALASVGFHLIDPFVRGWVRRGAGPLPCRYAVVEDGVVGVFTEDVARG